MSDDDEILEKLRANPEDGARLLVGAYGRRLYAAAMRLCHNETDAEDLVSRTLARVVQSIGSFKGDSSFFTWQCSIMVNFFKMDIRRKAANSLVFPDELPERADERPSPAEAAERADDAREVRAAVASLPERLRAAVVMFYFAGMSVPAIAKSMGEPEAYLAYAESVGDGTTKTEAEKEQIYFNSAEQVFLSGNYQKALTSLQKYFDEYPSGARATEARFYEAECYMNLGQKENAVDSYAKVMTAPDAGSFLEPAILNYSVLSYGLEHYSDAYNGYSMLREKARMDDNVFAAKVGMMRSAYRAKDYRDALAAADGVKSDSRCDEALGREADFVKAKSLMGTSQRAAAMDIFRRLAAKPSTDEGAEAAYTLIQSTYDEGNFDSVEKMVYDFASDAGTQNYWLAKAFIVLGDAFAEQDNLKQAKATFESIANGYESTGPEDDVLDAVAMRLEKLSQMM